MKLSTHLKSYLFALTFTIISTGLFAQTSNWHIITGGSSNRNGLMDISGPILEVGQTPQLYWEGGESTPYASYPAAYDDNLILTRRWPSNHSGESWIINLNLYTGEEHWRTTLPAGAYDNYGKVSAVNNGMVYANRAGGSTEPALIHALDIDTGDLLWTSQLAFGECWAESIVFADNGDIIAADSDHVVRINYLDGTTIWEVPRDFGSSSDGNAPNVYGDKIYLWAQSAQGMYIKALDINTGNILYDSPLLVSPGFQQMGFMVGSNGTIYAGTVRGMGNDKMYALQDDGFQITILWERPMGYCLWGNHLEGPDGSIYMLNPNDEIERLDPATGNVFNTSSSVALGDGGLMINMAAGADGSIYVVGNDWPNSKIWFFTADLQEMWSENLSGGRGIVVAEDIVFVNGKNTQMKAYGPHDLSIQDMTDVNSLSVYPNPSDDLFT
ncbi:MAG: PQQ-binding-like beta-propeller repeat protein, partial [Bacteroidota bacterium]